jgi:hypothetical protein
VVEVLLKMRGSVFDLPYFGVLVILLVFASLITYSIVDSISTQCENVQVTIGAPTYASDACTQSRVAVTNFVNMVGIIIFFAGLAILVYSATVQVSINYLVVGILVWLLTLVAFIQISGAFSGIFSSAFFTPIAIAFPLPIQIVQNIHWFIAVIGMFLIAILYRGRAGSGSGRPEG